LFFTATHNGKHAVLCACLPAGNRRIDKLNILFAAFVVQFARDLCRSSSVVDIQAAGFHAAKGSVRSENDAAKVVIVAHTAEDNICPGCGFAWRGASPAAVFSHPFFGLVRAAVIHGDFVPGAREMSGHGVAHDTQPEKGDVQWRGFRVLFYCGLCHGWAPDWRTLFNCLRRRSLYASWE